MQNILAIVETAEGQLAPISAEVVGLARRLADELGGEVDALAIGSGLSGKEAELGGLGADRVYLADDPRYAQYEGEAYVAAAEAATKQANPGVVLVGHTLNGRDVAARLAFRLGVPLATDCVGVRLDGETLVMNKPVFGGNAVAEYVAPDARPQMATIRPRAFEPPTDLAARQPEVVQVSADGPSRVEVLETVKEEATGGPRLKDAKIVVSGGRGLGGPENWHFVEELADPLGAAVGATRAVTDAGWVPPSMQVGLTGITITPDLYVTVAVSGAVQHIAGCSGARNIVAINKDPEANIFRHARYGVVGDWKQVLPGLTAKVKELRGS
jgi:electron transfer flavoprotein alpha subunit